MKRDAKLEEKLICCFKNYKNSVNFDLNTGSFLNFHFDWFLLCKVYNFLLKKITEELCFMTQKTDAKSEEKLTCGLKNDMRNLANFYQRTRKSQNWYFDGIYLSKVENV